MLLGGVREVAALASPAEPESVSQRVFDAARERSASHASLPRAKRIAERLGLPWREVVALAHEPAARQNQLLAVKARELPQNWLADEHVVTVLGLVARRLGADSVTTGAYRVERARLLAEDRARPRNGRWLLLPDDEQIIACAGSWDAALRLAGLQTTCERDPVQKRTGAPTLVDLLERFHDEHGVQPSARDLRAFARGNGVPYPSERAQRFGAAVAEWGVSHRARGLPEPCAVKRVGGRGNRAPDYSRDVSAARPGERRRGKWTRVSCAAAVARYLAQLRRGDRSTERGYADWVAAQSRGDAPALATIQAFGGWEAARREAQRIATGAPSPSPARPVSRSRRTHTGGDEAGLLLSGANRALVDARDKLARIEEAKRVRQILSDRDYLNDQLPAMLERVTSTAELGSISRDTRHHDYHDNWNDLAEAVRALQSALETFRAEHAPPAVPDDGDKPWGAMGDDENHLVDAAEKFDTFLDAVIASGE
jgi:hypothetical protein